ncbi:MAG: hypothetical protein ABIJ96_01625 [Elusimicrobiota bacterium]
MNTLRVYRNINAKNKFMGLELVDGRILLLIFFGAFMLNKEGLFLNFLFLIGAYLGLRALKRGKPDGYLLCLTRYVLMSRFKRVRGTTECDVLEGYPRL